MADKGTTSVTGVTTDQTPDTATGVIHQRAASTRGTQTFTADGDKNFGIPILMSGNFTVTADGTTNIELMSKNSPQKYQVVDAWYFVRTLRTGGAPDHKVRVFQGDGATSEVFAGISDDADVDGATLDAPTRFATLDDANHIIDVNESLRLTLVVAGTTTGGTALIDVHVLLVPIKF